MNFFLFTASRKTFSQQAYSISGKSFGSHDRIMFILFHSSLWILFFCSFLFSFFFLFIRWEITTKSETAEMKNLWSERSEARWRSCEQWRKRTNSFYQRSKKEKPHKRIYRSYMDKAFAIRKKMTKVLKEPLASMSTNRFYLKTKNLTFKRIFTRLYRQSCTQSKRI